MYRSEIQGLDYGHVEGPLEPIIILLKIYNNEKDIEHQAFDQLIPSQIGMKLSRMKLPLMKAIYYERLTLGRI